MRRELVLGLTADASPIASQKRWEDLFFLTTIVFRSLKASRALALAKQTAGLIVLVPEDDAPAGCCKYRPSLGPTLSSSCSTILEHATVLKNTYPFGL